MTLKELAILLDLAPSTVSRALHGYPDISEYTRKRVEALAEQLQYSPDTMATGLRNWSFNLIAVIVPDLQESLFITALQGISAYTFGKNYRILLYESQEDVQKEAEICRSLEKSGIDGLLISPVSSDHDRPHIRQLAAKGIPFVLFGRTAGNIAADRVIGDDYSGARIAVSYLIEHGCRKIAHIAAPQQWLWAQKRQMGYLQALHNHGIRPDRQLIPEYTHLETIKGIVEKLLPHRIDGIFTVDDKSAAQTLIALRQLNRRIPEDISVCGYGNASASPFTCPALTTIEPNGRQIGRTAAELLLQRIEKKENGDTQTILVKNRLVVRSSVRT